MRVFVAFVLLAAACSTPTAGGGGGVVAADAKGDVKAADVADAGDAGAAVADVEAVPDVDDAGAPDVEQADYAGFFDDASSADVAPSDTQEPPPGPVGNLYAHTKDSLYKLDLAAGAVTLVGKFKFDKNEDLVTDIAVDRFGQLYSVTYKDLFVCNIETAACKWLATLNAKDSVFYGLTFVPKGTLQVDQDTLIGITDDGKWNAVKFSGGKAQIASLGQFGGGWLLSGDAFSVESVGTYVTLKGKGNSDSLAVVDPKNGKLVQVIGETGVKSLFGLAWWAGVFYGFSNDGNVYTLDVTTGKATPVQGIQVPQGVKWWGAGVSTRAAGGK